ncbi:MAG: thioredoxin family protein [Burkholderiaceae bacterium]
MSDLSSLRVVCLCAQWCGVCREYAAVFDQVRAALGTRCEFIWVDVEDEADLMDSVDVENFPTLLILRGDAVAFFGMVTPHAGTLTRLVQSALDGALPPPDGRADEIAALATRILAWHAQHPRPSGPAT